jgi:hypothetical protein
MKFIQICSLVCALGLGVAPAAFAQTSDSMAMHHKAMMHSHHSMMHSHHTMMMHHKKMMDHKMSHSGNM